MTDKRDALNAFIWMVTSERFIHRLNIEGTITCNSHFSRGDLRLCTTLYLSFETWEGFLKPYWEVIKDSVNYWSNNSVQSQSKQLKQPSILVDLEIISRAHIWPLNEGACMSWYFKLWRSWRSLCKNSRSNSSRHQLWFSGCANMGN